MEAPLSRLEKEQLIYSQVYSVRFQTLITSQNYRDSESDYQKQLLGTFIYEHVKTFLDQALMQRGIIMADQQQGLTPKITGMIMSLPVAHLTIGISTYQGLFTKVQEALALLVKNKSATAPAQSLL